MAGCDVLFYDPAHADPGERLAALSSRRAGLDRPRPGVAVRLPSSPPPAHRPVGRRTGRPHSLGPTRPAGRPEPGHGVNGRGRARHLSHLPNLRGQLRPARRPGPQAPLLLRRLQAGRLPCPQAHPRPSPPAGGCPSPAARGAGPPPAGPHPDPPAAAPCRDQPSRAVLRGVWRPPRAAHLPPRPGPPTTAPAAATTACAPRPPRPGSPRKRPPAEPRPSSSTPSTACRRRRPDRNAPLDQARRALRSVRHRPSLTVL
jgi:hypothetical protein